MVSLNLAFRDDLYFPVCAADECETKQLGGKRKENFTCTIVSLQRDDDYFGVRDFNKYLKPISRSFVESSEV